MSDCERVSGKTCIVTGFSRGIGFHTAKALALAGARVVLIGHHRKQGRDALRRIRDCLDGPPSDSRNSVAFPLVDLSVQDEIRRFAAPFREDYRALDVLVNNAGGFFMGQRERADGI